MRDTPTYLKTYRTLAGHSYKRSLEAIVMTCKTHARDTRRPSYLEDRATEEQNRMCQEMHLRVEKTLLITLYKAQERRPEETAAVRNRRATARSRDNYIPPAVHRRCRGGSGLRDG
jgi:hypothetical protein